MFEFIFPSIIAIIVSLIAYFSTIISAKRQIESSQKIANLDFRTNVLSNNRQLWINELRNLISELLSLIDSYSIDPKRISYNDYQKIVFLVTKTELMLNPEKDCDYINAILNLKDALYKVAIKEINYSDVLEKVEIVKNMTKVTLKKEWERVKIGE